jgi:addiction module RelE/StbE family toxin
MVKIVWSEQATKDLNEIFVYISRDSPYFATLLANQIHEVVSNLINFPHLGRMVPEFKNPSIREIIFKNYRIIYKIKQNNIEIITIFHGRRLLK